MADDEDWFAPKRYGYGTGMPIAWQGWVLTALVIGVILTLVLALGDRPLQLVAALIPVVLAFVVVAVRKTRGGLRWRWGEEE